MVPEGMKIVLVHAGERCGESSEKARTQSERSLGEYSFSRSLSSLQKLWENLYHGGWSPLFLF